MWQKANPKGASTIKMKACPYYLGGVLIYLLIVALATADSTCIKGCPNSDNGLLNYTPGNFYEYAFDSILTVGINSGLVSEADDSSLKVTGSAKIFSNGNCGYTLQVGTVKVTNSKESLEKKLVNNIQKPVHFTLVSGQLQSQICADASDSEYSLNVKRAIISLLQSDTGSDVANEIDVFGLCPTHTSTSKSGNKETITKVRNLNKCAHREQVTTGLLSGIVNEKAGVTSSSLFQSEYSKESKIERGIVENVHLVETYKFSGVSKTDSEVTAKVVTTLKLKNPGGTPGNLPTSGSHATSIIYQKSETYSSKNFGALKVALSDLVDLTSDYVKKDSAKNFVELIRLFRQSDTDTLLELSAFPHPNKVLARKVYLDALFRTNTAESAKAILKQINKFDEKEKLISILSLNLIESVDKETLSLAAAQLSSNAPKEIYLAVGSLVSKYCVRNGCQVSDIETISKKFVEGLKHCKPNTRKDEERTVYILKGIGNAQNVANHVATALSECASPGRSNRVRVSALQAFSAISCHEALISKSVDLLKDYNEDSELRIEAYLAAINCPTAELANQISEIVNSEKVFQVGGFIESNLKAIRDSTDATREQQRYHLGNIRVSNRFPQDYRRYSFNNEISYKLDALGVSASSDYKMIYSQHGFLPRSARLNVTTEIFGKNFNVFEANVRQENLENVLEYYIGPKGLLNKDFDEIVKLIEVGNSAGNGAGGRARRSIADEAAKTAKKYKSYGSKNLQDINLDISLKIFGSEIAFLSLGDNIPSTLDDIIKTFSEAFDKAKKELSSFEKQYAGHHLFLDSKFTYPTGIGIPLELAAQGFAANKIDFAVNIDVNAILEQNWQRAKYRLKLVPSVDLNVNIQLGFNAQVLSTGIRVVSSAHSATGSDVSVSLINDGDGFNVNVELPREKLELIDFQVNTEFYVAEQDKPLKAIPLKGTQVQKSAALNEMCFNQLEIVGLNACVLSTTTLSDINTSNTNKRPAIIDEIHLSRPFAVAIYLKTEREFNFKGSHSTLESGSQQWKLEYSTPGSKVSHDTIVAFEFGTNPRTFGRLSFDNTQYHLGVETGITNDNSELVIYGQYEQDKNIKKSKIGFRKSGNEFKPLIEIQDKNGVTNNINGYHLDGKIIVQKTGEKQARYNFDNFQILSPNSDRVALNGWADVGPTSLNAELHIAPNQQSYFVKSNFKLDNGHYGIGLFVNDEQTPENVYGSSAQLSISKNAYELKLAGKAISYSINSETQFEYIKPENVNALQSGKFVQNFIVEHKNKPFGSIKVHSTFETDKFQFDGEAVRNQKIASVNIKYQSHQRSVHDYELLAKAKLNKHSIDFVSKCDVSGNFFVVDNSFSTSWGTSLTAKGELGQRYSPQDVHIDLQGIAQLSSKEKPIQWIFKVLGTPEKTNSEIRVSRDNTEMARLTSETQHPQDKISAAKVNLIVKNLLTAKGDFKIAKNGKGELTATIDTQKSDQKHKLEIDSKFYAQVPRFDIDISLKLDNDKKLHFKTENYLDKVKFSTKNIFEPNDEKIMFDANGSIKGEWRTNGEVQGIFTLTTPSGRIIDGSINRHVTTNVKTQLIQGTAHVQINDQEPVTGKKRSLALKGKLDRFNVKTNEYALNSQLVFTAINGQKSELNYHIKHLAKGQNKALDFGVSAHSNLISQPCELSVVLDEYSAEHSIAYISGKYGELLAELNGKYNMGQSTVPATFEIQGKLQVPNSKFKSLEVNSNGKFFKPADINADLNLEFVLNSKSGDGKFTRFSSIFKGSSQQGSYSVEAHNNNLDHSLKLDGSYQREQSGNVKEGNASGKQKYGINAQYGDKYIKSSADITYDKATTATVHYTLDSSYEAAKDIEIDMRSHKAAEGSHTFTAQVKQAEKAYGLDTKLYSSTHKKGLDMRASLPKAQPIILVAIFERLGDRKAKLTVDINNLADLDLKFNSEASYTNIDDFYVIGSWNSKKLHLDNYVLDIKAHGKNIQIHLKDAQTVIFLGTATYSLKKEQNKAIIEGQGQVQYLGKTHTGNFKLTRQNFDLSTEKETGFSYTLNCSFGPKNGISMLKITNKEFNTKLSICEEKRQCTNIQLQSTIFVDEQKLNSVQHDVLILVDLRELGYPYELQFKSKNMRQGFKYQYNLEGHIVSGNNLKYQITANVLPTVSTIKLTLPKRQILFESTQQLPTDGNIFGHYEQSVAFYIDKLQRPNDVARISAALDISGKEQVALNARAHIKVEHPTMRSLSITATVDASREQRSLNSEIILDIFRLPEQKVIATSKIRNSIANSGYNITSNQQIRSSGLQFQYELNTYSSLIPDKSSFSAGTELQSSTSNFMAGAHISSNKERVEISINALNEQILYIAGDFDWQKHAAKINSKLLIFGQKPVVLTGEMQSTSAKITLKRQSLIDASAEIKLGKEFKFDVVGKDKPILNGRIALDAANFLQTNYKTNDDNVAEFLNFAEAEIKKETDAINENVKLKFKNIQKEFDQKVKLVSESTQDFTKLKSAYGGSLKTILKELQGDPSLAPIIDSIQALFDKINEIIVGLTQAISENYEKLHKSFVELYEKLNDLWKDSMLKAWEQLVVATSKLLGQLRVEIFNVYTRVVKDVIGWLEKYGPVLKSYGKAINESFKPLQEVMQELFNVIVHVVEDITADIKEYMAKLPTFESIRNEIIAKLEHFQVIEKVVQLINSIFEQLQILPQTPESNELLQKLKEYIQAKLTKQTINDQQWIDDLSKLLVKALRSVYAAFRNNTPVGSVPATDLQAWLGFWPRSADLFANLPALHSFQSSTINFLLNINWEGVFSKDFFSFWLFSQDFELHGHIIDGQHIFSFDGQNYAYPGNCKYVLAQDSVDNNFTVVAQLNSGKLKGLTLIDRDGNYIEVSDTVALKVNGKPVEYPQHLPGIHAWRLFYTVHLHSEYGVNVVCTTDLKVCHINVNGFYTGKTRGLLGNGNAEPFDDYLLIDGTLAADSAALGNEYGIGKCSPVAFDKGHPETPSRNDICSDIFGIESPLAANYLVLDSRPYRKACDVAVLHVSDKEKEAVACTFALAYGSALKLQHKWVLLPTRCLKCSGAPGQREFGEEFTVKIPTNKADVVFVVDINVTPPVMANLIAPAITEIRESLKVRGFTDIQVGVVAFDETKRYPALLTSDNGKINYKGNVANVQLNGPKNFCESCVEQIITEKRILEIYNVLERFIKTIVPQSDEKAFELALDFPFRAGAAKSIIGVRSNSLEYNNWWKFVRAHITGAVTKFDGALLHLIAPIKGLVLEGVPTEKLVGFNSRLVATLDGKDNKKRTKLQFENDMGIDFVLNNGGWAFDTQNFDKLKPADQKKVLSQVVSSIADTLFKTETVSDCRCLPLHGLHGQHKCAIKSTTFVPNKKPKSV